MSRKKKHNKQSRAPKTTQNAESLSGSAELFSEEKWIELQAEAYYRAIKRAEEEKKKVSVKKPSEKWYKKIIILINVIVFPWLILERKKINTHVYDGVLVIPISMLLMFGGTFFWLGGVGAIITLLCGNMENSFSVWMISVLMIFVGSLMIVSGKTFGEEEDSMKIYAYSASIIALVSCIVSIVALLLK